MIYGGLSIIQHLPGCNHESKIFLERPCYLNRLFGKLTVQSYVRSFLGFHS